MGGRSGKQCRERWYNHLSPAVTKAEWSVEEDDAIHRKVLELGTRRGMHTQEWLHHSLLYPGVPACSPGRRASELGCLLLIAILRLPERRAP